MTQGATRRRHGRSIEEEPALGWPPALVGMSCSHRTLRLCGFCVCRDLLLPLGDEDFHVLSVHLAVAKTDMIEIVSFVSLSFQELEALSGARLLLMSLAGCGFRQEVFHYPELNSC
jgi:hypothetical protein